MAARESLTRLAESWSLRIIAPLVLAAFGAGATLLAWQESHPTKAEAQELVAGMLNVYDHGTHEDLPRDSRVHPPVVGVAAALKECQDQSRELHQAVDRMDRLALTQYRWFVSTAAADAERDPRKRAEAASRAVREFNVLVRVEHVEIDEAARQVLETSPY